MAVMQMDRISICALKKDRKRLMEFLQRQGNVELQKVEPDEVFSSMDTQVSCQLFEKGAGTAASALEILGRYCPQPSSAFGFLSGREVLTVAESEAFAARWGERMSDVERIKALDRESAQAQADISKIEAAEEALVPWLDLSVPMTFQGTARTQAWIGSIQGEYGETALLHKMTEAVPVLGPVAIEIIRSSKEMTSFCVLALKRDAKGVEEALNALGFMRPSGPSSHVPSEALERLKEKKRQAQARIDASAAEIRGFEPLRKEIRMLEDYLRMRREKYAVLTRLGQSKHALVLSGYVAREDVGALEKKLHERFDCAVELAPADGDEDAPVRLKNRPFAAATESVLESYSMPSRMEIDPSPVMSFFYYLMFGMMLSDAGYGLIMALVCGILPLIRPRMEDSWRRSLRMFFWCGVSTVFWGVMFSSYFGDAVNVISKNFFGREVGIPPLWFLPLEQPMRLLMFCLGIGVVHLVAGYVMKARNLAARGQYADILYDCGYPVLMLTGLLVLLMGSDMFRTMAGFSISLPGWVNQTCLLISGASLMGVVLTGGRESRNWGKRILKGLYAAYNVAAGWLGDILSYSRLLALGLATGVIASVFNALGALAGAGVLGAVIFILVFLIGQTMNMGINLLGAYVHSNRLEYVEFFGKFYEGGGRKFQPFGVHTKYYKVEEET
jgi:V/A-type H+-transporting ATPase subunit I